MKKISAIYLVLMCFFGCINHEENISTPSLRDSTIEKHDSTKKPIIIKSDSSLSKILTEYIKGYKDTIIVDTSFNKNDKEIKVNFRHYCTNYSAIRIPGKYVSMYGMNEFKTHNFQSNIKISTGGKLIIDTVITKELFGDKIFLEEKLYGVLLYPNPHFTSNSLLIDYSISIPLTDVGVGVSLEFDYSGKIKVR